MKELEQDQTEAYEEYHQKYKSLPQKREEIRRVQSDGYKAAEQAVIPFKAKIAASLRNNDGQAKYHREEMQAAITQARAPYLKEEASKIEELAIIEARIEYCFDIWNAVGA